MDHHPPTSGASGHEPSDVRLKPIAVFFVVLTMVTVIAGFVVDRLHRVFEAQAARQDVPMHPLAEPREIPPSPRLQRTPSSDLASQRAREEAWLHGYGWIDKSQEVARIPIDRAIDLLLEQPPAAREQR